jgi:hypothetical protein
MKIDKIRIEKIETWSKHKPQKKEVKTQKLEKKEWKQIIQGKGNTVKSSFF